jgi:hypothetical protein
METNKNIMDLEDLLREKYRVSIELQSCKKELHHSMMYLKHNHKSMIWSFINPIDKNTSLGSLLSNITTVVSPIIKNAAGLNTENTKNGNLDLNVALAVLIAESIKSWIEKRRAKKKTKVNSDQDAEISIQDEI